MNRLRALMGQRIAGVPVPVLFAVLVVVVYLIIRRRRAAAAAGSSSPALPTAVDESTPVGAMSGDGGFAGAGYAFPNPSSGSTATDTTGGQPVVDPITPQSSTTVTGDPAPSQDVAGATVQPAKKKPTAAAHKAGKVAKAKPAPHPHAAKAPAKKTTVHRAPVVVHKRPAPKKPPPKKKPAPLRTVKGTVRVGPSHKPVRL